MQRVKMVPGALLAFVLVGSAGCFVLSAPTEEQLTVVSTEVPPPSVMITAVPSYRLIVEARDADSPSRLLLLYTRVETVSDDSLRFDPSQAKLVLPDGTRAGVFDRARASTLLDRTELGSWDLSYTRDASRRRSSGGFPPAIARQLKEQVRGTLLDATELRRGQPVMGFLLVDTGVPLASLERASLEVVARRVGDAQAVREVYQFAATSTAQPSR